MYADRGESLEENSFRRQKKVDPLVTRAVGNFVSETLGDRRFESRPVQQPPPPAWVSSFVDHRILSSLRHALTNFSYEKSILSTNTFSPTEFASFFFLSLLSSFHFFFLFEFNDSVTTRWDTGLRNVKKCKHRRGAGRRVRGRQRRDE